MTLACVRTYAMATLLPSMMMCLSSGFPGSFGRFKVKGVLSDWWKRPKQVTGGAGGSFVGGVRAMLP